MPCTASVVFPEKLRSTDMREIKQVAVKRQRCGAVRDADRNPD